MRKEYKGGRYYCEPCSRRATVATVLLGTFEPEREPKVKCDHCGVVERVEVVA